MWRAGPLPASIVIFVFAEMKYDDCHRFRIQHCKFSKYLSFVPLFYEDGCLMKSRRQDGAGYKYQTWMCYKRKYYCSVCNMHQTYFFVQSYWHWIWDACIWGIYKTKFVHLVLLGNISVSLDIINTKRSPRVRGTACYAFGSSLHIMHIVHIHHIAYYAYQYWFDRIK